METQHRLRRNQALISSHARARRGDIPEVDWQEAAVSPHTLAPYCDTIGPKHRLDWPFLQATSLEVSPTDECMRDVIPFRALMLRALLMSLLAGVSGGVYAQRRAPNVRSNPRAESVSFPVARGQQQRPAPIERRNPPGQAPLPNGGGARLSGPNREANMAGRRGEHLPEWMAQHSDLTLEQQQQALGREPGFNELPAATQQRMRERLSQLNAMSPLQRQRLLAHNEAMERLNPEQRTQVRGAMQMWGSLPVDQRRQVMQSFRELRQLPPNRRMSVIMSPQYQWMNPAQRTALVRLIQVEPMLPEQ